MNLGDVRIYGETYTFFPPVEVVGLRFHGLVVKCVVRGQV